jgi:hypothetical protein
VDQPLQPLESGVAELDNKDRETKKNR